MAANTTSSRRQFTDAARQAAVEARRLKRDLKIDPNRPEIFVVRGVQDARLFTWEIRRYGGVLLQDSDARFTTVLGAESAGQQALSVFVGEP